MSSDGFQTFKAKAQIHTIFFANIIDMLWQLFFVQHLSTSFKKYNLFFDDVIELYGQFLVTSPQALTMHFTKI